MALEAPVGDVAAGVGDGADAGAFTAISVVET